MIKAFNRAISNTADSFGGLPFIVLYNIITFVWVGLGLVDKHFFDPFPSNFYTLTVSWLAINMSSLLLYVGKRQQARENQQEEHKMQMLETLLAVTESQSAIEPLLKQVAHNQVTILEHLRDQTSDNARKAAVKRH